MKYRILNKQEFSDGDYSIIPIREEDKFLIMHWRNRQLEILRQKTPLTEQMQTEYFMKIVIPQFSMDEPQQILVSYLLKGQLIGYGGIVHIKWIDKRGEVSFLLETERNSNIELFKRDYSIFLKLIKKLAFDELGFNKLTTEAFDLRPYLIETLEKNEFELEGRLKKHNIIKGQFVDSLLHGCFSKTFKC